MLPLAAIGIGALLVIFFILGVKPDRALSSSLVLTLWSVTLFGMFLAPTILWQGSLAFSIVILLIGIYRARQGKLRHGGVLLLVVLWLVYVVMTSVFAMATYPLPRATLLFGASVLAVIAALMLTVEGRVRVLRGLVSIGTFQTLVCIWEVSPVGFPIYGYRNGAVTNPLLGGIVDRAQGTLGHPNPLAMVLCLALVAALSNEARLSRRWQVVVVPVILVGILLTGTRIALPAAVVGIVLYLLLERRIGRLLRSVLLIAVAGSAVLAQLSEAAIEVFTELGRSGSWQQRLGSVSAYPSLFSRPDPDFWFGSGFGNEAALYAEGWIVSPFGVALVDNWPIYILGTLGFIGFVLFVALWGAVVVKSDRVGVALSAVLTVFFFNFDIGRLLSPTVVMFMFFALALKLPERKLRGEGPDVATRRDTTSRQLKTGGQLNGSATRGLRRDLE